MLKLSVIVPCKDEEEYIGKCLDALLDQQTEGQLEIIVVDNGSTDKTVSIVSEKGDRVRLLHLPDETIAAVRNYGASQSVGDWLAFIDADVEVADDWFQSFRNWASRQAVNEAAAEQIVTGSTYRIPPDAGWIESVWFAQLQCRDRHSDRYINSGHLIVHRSLFQRIGGFDPAYRTGEDEKFCDDARKAGGKIYKESSLRAVHHGYPATVRTFYRREKWHGMGMKQHLDRPWKYRDLQLAIYNWLILGLLLILAVLGLLSWVSFLAITIALVSPLFIFSLKRSGLRFRKAMALTFLFFVYGLAKTAALGGILMGRKGNADRTHKAN